MPYPDHLKYNSIPYIRSYETRLFLKWQSAILTDASSTVSKQYRSFQTALIKEISRLAASIGARMISHSKGHYYTSCFIERNGQFVYINHSSGLSRIASGVRIELDSILIRTATDDKDFTGSINNYCDINGLQSFMDRLLK